MSHQIMVMLLEGSAFALAAGLVYGIFGGGSGLFLMPAYFLLLRHFPMYESIAMQTAIATTCIASAILGLIPSIMQKKQGNVDVSLFKCLFPGMLTGTMLAVIIVNLVSSHALKNVFGFVVLLVAGWFWFYRQEKDTKCWCLSGFSHYCCSTAIGTLWFSLGIAIFTVPYLHKCNVDMRRSIGTATVISSVFSLIAGLLFMVVGMVRYDASAEQLGYVNTVLLALTIIPCIVGGIIGTKITVLLPHRHLKKFYSILVFIIGLLMLLH